jgi:hypothetical protein
MSRFFGVSGERNCKYHSHMHFQPDKFPRGGMPDDLLPAEHASPSVPALRSLWPVTKCLTFS